MIDGLVSGRLYGTAQVRTGQHGTHFVTCRVRAAAGDGESLFINVIAFDDIAKEALQALDDGDSVSLAGADPMQPPAIDPNFFGDPADLESMVAGYKTTRRLLETPALRALQTREMFTAGIETDDDIRALLRARVDTVYHPVGTARMGTDAMAVVDPKLRVWRQPGRTVNVLRTSRTWPTASVICTPTVALPVWGKDPVAARPEPVSVS